jgi:hypothetical protein
MQKAVGRFEPIAEIATPCSLKVLGPHSFAFIKSIHSITFQRGSKPVSIEKFGFQEPSRSSICIPASCGSFSTAALMSSSWREITFQLPSQSHTFGDGVFAKSSIQQVRFPAGLKLTPKSPFESCPQVDSLRLEQRSTLVDTDSLEFADVYQLHCFSWLSGRLT